MKDPKIGLGGAPTRCTTLPEDPAARKQVPLASGLFDYFPDSLAAVAHVSWRGNEQHNPGQPLHWARSKSADEADTMLRHFAERGTLDTDGIRHSAKMAWRALALLQKEIEAEQAAVGAPTPEELDAHSAERGSWGFPGRPATPEELVVNAGDGYVPNQFLCREYNPGGGGCCRVQGHAGDHIAFGTQNNVFARWPQ